MNHEKGFQRYIRRVLIELRLDRSEKEKIAQDLTERLQMKYFDTGVEDPRQLLGSPRQVAKEYQEKAKDTSFSTGMTGHSWEYRSPVAVFGIPLIHINRKPGGVAKGIFAVGTYAIGVVAIGAISTGVISIGALSLGLLIGLGSASLSGLFAGGGVAVSLGAAFGGIAISYVLSVGGLTVAKELAIGGVAYGDVAMGDRAIGLIAIFHSYGEGEIIIPMDRHISEIHRAIRSVKGDWIFGLERLVEWVYGFRFY